MLTLVFIGQYAFRVYSPSRMKRLESWVVKHHLSEHGTRYRIDRKQKKRLDILKNHDRLKIVKYIGRQLKEAPTAFGQISGEKHIDKADAVSNASPTRPAEMSIRTS